jgi:hypothetical protein
MRQNKMAKNKTSFSLLGLLKQLLNQFFAWISKPFRKIFKKKELSEMIIKDSQGEITLKGYDYNDFLDQYLKIRHISAAEAGRLELEPGFDDAKYAKYAKRYEYVPPDYLQIGIGEPNKEKETRHIPPDMLVSDFLSQYEGHHQIEKPGKLMIEGRIVDSTQKVKDLGSTPESLLNLHYIPFKPAYVPSDHTITIIFPKIGRVAIGAQVTDTIEEILVKAHKALEFETESSPEQIEVLSFLGKDFKGQQTFGEILALAEEQKHTTSLVFEHKLCPAPVVLRINYDREIYRIECDTSKTVPDVLKMYFKERHIRDEEGSLKALAVQKANDPPVQLTPEVVATYGKKLSCDTDEYDLDNTKTLAEQNITAGSYISAEYKPKKK